MGEEKPETASESTENEQNLDPVRDYEATLAALQRLEQEGKISGIYTIYDKTQGGSRYDQFTYTPSPRKPGEKVEAKVVGPSEIAGTVYTTLAKRRGSPAAFKDLVAELLVANPNLALPNYEDLEVILARNADAIKRLARRKAANRHP